MGQISTNRSCYAPSPKIGRDDPPKDINGKEIFEADRVFVISELTFATVEYTRPTAVVAWNKNTESSSTYKPDNLLVSEWFNSDEDIYQKYKRLSELTSTVVADTDDFVYNDSKGTPIHVGDTVITIEKDSVTSRVLELYSGRVHVDW